MPLPFPFDFKNPDYPAVFEWRRERISRIRKDIHLLPALFKFYQENPVQFIIDWGCTSDPRHIEIGLPAVIPFLLFPKQEECLHWFLERWKNREPGALVKSREMGVTWLFIAIACTICMFNDSVVVGFGSRKEEALDKLGDPNSIFYKGRQFISLCPQEFRKDWSTRKHAPYMRIIFPNTHSIIVGEAGDNIGRGGRTSFTVVDEAAHLVHPELVDAALSQTTNCRIDISTPCGPVNSFAQKINNKNISNFLFSWRDDPRKDQAWYDRMVGILDPVIIAQEIDCNFNASVEGVVIPSEWIQAAVDAHIKLGIETSGIRKVSLDVADEGGDLNAACGRHGFLVEFLDQWTGKGSDIYATVQRVFLICDLNGYDAVDYDADGVGAGVRGDAKNINEKRETKIDFNSFRGSGEIIDPEREMIQGRKNRDLFENAKAQAWWSLRYRFQKTYRAIVEGLPYIQDELISIPSGLKEITKLLAELSHPIWSLTSAGKIVINKKPDGARSPNLADAVMIAFAPIKRRIGWFNNGKPL